MSEKDLIPRLDACFKLIKHAQDSDKSANPMLDRLQEQGLVYAGFLTDLQENRIQNPGSVAEMTALIKEFCQLIETEFPPLQPT